MAEDHIVKGIVAWPFSLYREKLGRKVTKHVKMAIKTDETAQGPDQHTGNSMPYSLRLVSGFFNVPQAYEH